MKPAIKIRLLLLLFSLLLLGLGWVFKSNSWAGANILLVAGGGLTAFFAIVLVWRLSRNPMPRPMD